MNMEDLKTSKYISTPETQNFAKVCRLFVDLLRDVLWEALTKRILPDSLPEIVRMNKSKLDLAGRMTEEQYKRICKPGGWNVSSEDFDISLLYILLRYLPMKPKIQGCFKHWGSYYYPDDKSIKEVDDIERIRIKQYQLFLHPGRASLSKDEFNKVWTDMEAVVERFDLRLSTDFKSEMEVILKDDTFEAKCIEDFKECKAYELETGQLAMEAKQQAAKAKKATHKSLEEIKKQIDETGRKVDEVSKKVNDLQKDVKEKKKEQSAGTETYKWKMECAKASKYISTPETQNFANVCRLFVHLLRDVLWEALTKRILPNSLPEIVRMNKTKLELAGRMTDEQYRSICKPGGMNVSSEDFDISLLCILLQYLPMKPKIQGSFNKFGSDDYPDEKHIREMDDIERIRIKRNQLFHHGRASLSKDEFDKVWTDMEAVVERFDLRLSTDFKSEMKVILKNDIFEEKYTENFKQQKAYELETRQLAMKMKQVAAEAKKSASKGLENIKKQSAGTEAYTWKKEHAKASNFISTPETQNFAKVCRLFVDLLRDVLWEALTKRILPDDLPEIVYRNKLKLAGRMTDEQYRSICEPGGMNVSSEDFDISLLYILLRYLPMKPKIQGSFKHWGSDDYPDDKHTREMDDIERIRIKRNQLFLYVGRASLSKDEFDKVWTDMEAVVERFDCRLSTNFKHEMEVILKDDKYEDEYSEDFKELKAYDLETRHLALEGKQEDAETKLAATRSSEKIKNTGRKPNDTLKNMLGLPPEILRMDKRSQQLYREALVAGKEKVYNIRLMIVGHLGVGKTTLTKRILDEDAVEAPHVSTEGIEVHPRSCKIDLDTKEWVVEKKEHRFPDNGQLLVNIVSKHVADKNANSNDDVSQEETNGSHILLTNPEQDMKGNIQQEGMNNASFGESIPVALEAKRKMSKSDEVQSDRNTASVKNILNVREEHSIHEKQTLLDPDRFQNDQNDSNETIGGTLDRDKSTEINDTRIHSDFHDFVTKYGTLTHSGKIFCYVTLLDFAGQFVFYTTHQTFMSWRTIYLLVTDMSKSLDDLVEEDKHSLNLNRNMESSIKDYAVYWLNSIYSHGMPTDTNLQCDGHTQYETEKDEENLNGAAKYPSVILVATHSDKVPEGRKDEKKNEYFDGVKRILKDRPQRFLLKGYFAISNFGPKTDIDDLKQKIFELAQEQDYWGEEIPARWLALEQKLMELKRSGVKIIEYSIVEEINTSSDVKIENPDELEVFLRFEHDLGNIVFFNTEKLRDKIVLDPEWLIDGVRVLISPSRHVIEDNPEMYPQWYSYVDTGRLTKPLIDRLWSEGKHEDFHKNRDHLLGLMEELSIIARPVEKVGSVEEHSYWVPCVIYKSAPNHVKNPKPFEGMTKTSTLCFESKTKFVHVGVFHRLVASFLSKWTPAQEEEGGEYHLYCGCCEFEVDQCHNLLLAQNDYVILATMFRYSSGGEYPDKELCSEVRKLISSMLAEITSCICPNAKFETCVKCDKSSTDTIKGLHKINNRVEERCKCSIPTHTVKVETLLKFWEQNTDPVKEDHHYSRTTYSTRHMECQVPLWRRSLPPEKKYHAFFSYSYTDIKWVRNTVKALEKDHGFVCCEYDRDNTPGTSLLQFVGERIKTAHKTVVVMTREAFQSDFVKREIEMAIMQGFSENRNCVVPVLLEDCDIPRHLSVLHYVDARDPTIRDIWWSKLLTELET